MLPETDIVLQIIIYPETVPVHIHTILLLPCQRDVFYLTARIYPLFRLAKHLFRYICCKNSGADGHIVFLFKLIQAHSQRVAFLTCGTSCTPYLADPVLLAKQFGKYLIRQNRKMHGFTHKICIICGQPVHHAARNLSRTVTSQKLHVLRKRGYLIPLQFFGHPALISTFFLSRFMP